MLETELHEDSSQLHNFFSTGMPHRYCRSSEVHQHFTSHNTVMPLQAQHLDGNVC